MLRVYHGGPFRADFIVPQSVSLTVALIDLGAPQTDVEISRAEFAGQETDHYIRNSLAPCMISALTRFLDYKGMRALPMLQAVV
jgi:hypothetical protein